MDTQAHDVQVVRSVLAGDTEAFADLVRQHQDAVFNLVWRMTGSRFEAEEITQDAFVRAFRKLPLFRPERGSFKSWLLTLAANLARNGFRALKRRREIGEDQLDPDSLPAAPVREADEEVEAVLARMPEALRVPLVLKHMEGQSYEEVAEILGIGLSAAKMRVLRAREAFVGQLRRFRGESP